MRNYVEVTTLVTCDVTAQSNERFVVATVKSYFYIQSIGYYHNKTMKVAKVIMN
jgi:hypothetical protein